MEEIHRHDINIKNLNISLWLNGTITVAEIVGGILSNSLSLLSDALHNLSDTIALFIAYLAHKIGKKRANKNKTFGYKRIEILSAAINALVLLAISVFLIVEAVKRFNHPQPVNGTIMMVVAVIGLLANLISVLVLHRDSHQNLNIKAAYLHLLGDTISSVAVVAGGLLIMFYDIYWIDPFITFLIAIYLIREAWRILKETYEILMQAAPRHMNAEKINQRISQLPEVKNIHHVHIWSLDDHENYFEAHVNLTDDLKLSQTTPLKHKIEKILKNEFALHHITLQLEYEACEDMSLINEK